MATSSFYLWRKTPHVKISKCSHIWVEPKRHRRSAGRPPHIKQDVYRHIHAVMVFILGEEWSLIMSVWKQTKLLPWQQLHVAVGRPFRRSSTCKSDQKKIYVMRHARNDLRIQCGQYPLRLILESNWPLCSRVGYDGLISGYSCHIQSWYANKTLFHWSDCVDVPTDHELHFDYPHMT